MKLNNMQSSASSWHFLPSGREHSSQHPVLEHTNGSLFCLNLTDQVSYADKTAGKIISKKSRENYLRVWSLHKASLNTF